MKTYRHITARKLTPKEEAFIRLLERQRHRRGYVRVAVNDPCGLLVTVICEYLSWWQRHVDARDALVFTPLKSPRLPIPRVYQTSARSFRKHQGKPLCIGQAVLFGADAYCPSVPLWRNYFDQIFSLACGYLNYRGTILIVHGNIARRRGRRTPFARKYAQLQDVDFYAEFDATVEQAFQPAPRRLIFHPKFLFTCEPPVARPIFTPYLPRGAPIAA